MSTKTIEIKVLTDLASDITKLDDLAKKLTAAYPTVLKDEAAALNVLNFLVAANPALEAYSAEIKEAENFIEKATIFAFQLFADVKSFGEKTEEYLVKLITKIKSEILPVNAAK